MSARLHKVSDLLHHSQEFNRLRRLLCGRVAAFFVW